MGHREDVWTNPIFHDVLAGGITWALGDITADVTPNLLQGRARCADEPAFSSPKDATESKKSQ
jgi:hypothetical protein